MNGILIVDKPKGLTSHDVVNFARRRLGIKRIGHAGSLDPIATGLLALLVGSATKLSAKLVNDDKVYEATMKCGIITDTNDAEGKVVEERRVEGLSNERIEEVVSKFRGRILQRPPYFSAVKHKGTPLYKWARRGVSVEKEPRPIHIKKLAVTAIRLPDISFLVHCSKGTYIRRLCDDIGRELGCGAHMTALRRLKSGDFGIEEAVSLDELAGMDEEALRNRLIEV